MNPLGFVGSQSLPGLSCPAPIPYLPQGGGSIENGGLFQKAGVPLRKKHYPVLHKKIYFDGKVRYLICPSKYILLGQVSISSLEVGISVSFPDFTICSMRSLKELFLM